MSTLCLTTAEIRDLFTEEIGFRSGNGSPIHLTTA